MSASLIKAVHTTASTLLRQIVRNMAIKSGASENVDGYPSKQWGSVETEEEGTLYYRFEVQREPFEDKTEIEIECAEDSTQTSSEEGDGQ